MIDALICPGRNFDVFIFTLFQGIEHGNENKINNSSPKTIQDCTCCNGQPEYYRADHDSNEQNNVI